MGQARERATFAADPLAVRAVLMRFERGAVLGAVSADHRDCVLLVLAEVLNNVAEHAYGGAVGPVAVSLRRGGGGIVAQVLDRGCDAPVIAGLCPAPVDLPEGGFGFGLIRALATGVEQRRRMGCNVLRFCVHADSQA